MLRSGEGSRLKGCKRCHRLDEDTAWHPITTAELDAWGDGTTGKIYKFFLGTPLKLWASVGHWAIWHFNINKFSEKQRPRVRRRPRFSGLHLHGGKPIAIARRLRLASVYCHSQVAG